MSSVSSPLVQSLSVIAYSCHTVPVHTVCDRLHRNYLCGWFLLTFAELIEILHLKLPPLLKHVASFLLASLLLLWHTVDLMDIYSVNAVLCSAVEYASIMFLPSSSLFMWWINQQDCLLCIIVGCLNCTVKVKCCQKKKHSSQAQITKNSTYVQKQSIYTYVYLCYFLPLCKTNILHITCFLIMVFFTIFNDHNRTTGSAWWVTLD